MNFDQTVLYFFNQTLANPILDPLMIGATSWSLVFMPLIGILYFAWGSRTLGKTLLLTLVLSVIGTAIFYYLALRPRPVNVRLIIATPPFPSFPSGHTTMAFGLATAWVLARVPGIYGQPTTRNGTAQDISQSMNHKSSGLVLVYLLACLVAVSRLYLGHHHPTDVIAGVVLGCATGAAIHGMMTVNGTLVERVRWLLWPQIAVAVLVTMMAYLNVLPNHLLRFPYSDKILHFLLFGSITFWLQLWLQNWKASFGRISLPFSILVPLSLALTEEGFQALSPLRTASLVDLSADAVGMVFFYLMAQRLILHTQTFHSDR